MLKPLLDAHSTAKVQFEKLAESRSLLDKVRVEMTSLDKLGDLVTEEDVIKGAGKLVAAGLSPLALAKLMSDLPDKGPAINSWLATHAATIAQREQQLDPVLEQARHQLGVSAMRVLAGHHLGGPPEPEAPLAPAASNALMPAESVGSPAPESALTATSPAAGGEINA